MSSVPQISVVVPILDEVENLPILHREITESLQAQGRSYEVVYVDDGSSDGSLETLVALWREDERVRVIQFRGNAGQTPAMAAGFDHSRGEVVVTIDGDLQNDPRDIPRLLERLDEGYDIVAGWRKSRQDGFVLRRLPSIIANRLINWVTGVRIHDTGCTLKVFRRRLVEKLPIYAEQHRFLPAMSAGSGARVSELVVNHRPRRFGTSKYGLGRAFRVFFDLFTIKLISSFSHRPIQYFALLALPFGALALFPVMSGLRNIGSPVERFGPLLLTGFLLSFMAAVYFLLLGLLAEIVVRASDVHDQEEGGHFLAHRNQD